jgi:hypothetical protein
VRPKRRTTRTLVPLTATTVVVVAAAFSAASGTRADAGLRHEVARCDPARGVKVVSAPDGIYLSAWTDTVSPHGGPASGARHEQQVARFERLAGKRLALVYVLNPLLGGKFDFPAEQVQAVRRSGAVPLISLLPISDWNVLTRGTGDPIFTMQAFADGSFDAGLRRWARAAQRSRAPLMVVFGQEIKAGGWPWDAKFNGGARTDGYGDPRWPDGPERFRDAFRRVVTVFRDTGVRNVTWVYWTSLPFGAAGEYPARPQPWDLDRYYYPGDGYVDWVAGGVFGFFPQGGWNRWTRFRPLADALYRQLSSFAPRKPQLLELAVAYSRRRGDMAGWIRDAYADLATGRWRNIRAVNWWHQRVPGTTSAIDVTARVRAAFRRAVAAQAFLERARLACRS